MRWTGISAQLEGQKIGPEALKTDQKDVITSGRTTKGNLHKETIFMVVEKTKQKKKRETKLMKARKKCATGFCYKYNPLRTQKTYEVVKSPTQEKREENSDSFAELTFFRSRSLKDFLGPVTLLYIARIAGVVLEFMTAGRKWARTHRTPAKNSDLGPLPSPSPSALQTLLFSPSFSPYFLLCPTPPLHGIQVRVTTN